MNTSHFFFMVLCLLGLTLTNSFQLDVANSKIYREKYDTVIQFPCVGGSGEYQWQFDGIQPEWIAKNGRIIIPRSNFLNNKYYALKVGIYDRKFRKFLRRSIIFSFDDTRFVDCFDADYDIDIDTPQKLAKYIEQHIKDQIRYSSGIDINIKPKKQLIHHHYDFPERNYIEKKVIELDIQWLRIAITQALESRRECRAVAKFLDIILSTIKTHISILRGQSENTRQQLYVIQEEIKFLKQQLDEYDGYGYEYGTDIKNKLFEFRKDITRLQEEKREIEDKIRYYTKDCDDHENQIYRIKKGSYADYHAKYEDAYEYTLKIDKEIRELEIRITKLKQQRALYQEKCDEYKYKCDEYRPEFDRINGLIAKSRGFINRFELRVTEIEVEIQAISVKIVDLQEELDQRPNQLYQQIVQKLQEQQALFEEKARIIEELRASFQSLELVQSEFEEEISKHYYYCYRQEKQDDIAEIPETTNADEFLTYLKNVFGAQPSSNIRARFSGSQVEIKHFSIFSPAWIKVYGIPYSAGYGNNMDLMETQFSCEQVDDLDVFSGKIKSITKNFIEVKGKLGDEYTVHLGGCTKLETATTSKIFEIGDDISFKGHRRKGKKNHYSGHHVTCY